MNIHKFQLMYFELCKCEHLRVKNLHTRCEQSSIATEAHGISCKPAKEFIFTQKKKTAFGYEWNSLCRFVKDIVLYCKSISEHHPISFFFFELRVFRKRARFSAILTVIWITVRWLWMPWHAHARRWRLDLHQHDGNRGQRCDSQQLSHHHGVRVLSWCCLQNKKIKKHKKNTNYNVWDGWESGAKRDNN